VASLFQRRFRLICAAGAGSWLSPNILPPPRHTGRSGEISYEEQERLRVCIEEDKLDRGEVPWSGMDTIDVSTGRNCPASRRPPRKLGFGEAKSIAIGDRGGERPRAVSSPHGRVQLSSPRFMDLVVQYETSSI
jgi:hypothetical protein